MNVESVLSLFLEHGEWATGGFEFLSKNFGDMPKEQAFGETIEMAFKNLLNGKELMTLSDDEIRSAVREYFTKLV